MKVIDNISLTKPSPENVTLEQFLKLQQLKSNAHHYYLDVIKIVSGKDGALWKMDDAQRYVEAVHEAIKPVEPDKPKAFKMGGKTFKMPFIRHTFKLGGDTFHLPTLKNVAKSVYTDLSISRYGAIENLAQSFKEFESNQIDNNNLELLPDLLAAVYCTKDEKFTDELYIKRREMFFHAPMSAVWNAFFFQLEWSKRYTKLFQILLTVSNGLGRKSRKNKGSRLKEKRPI